MLKKEMVMVLAILLVLFLPQCKRQVIVERPVEAPEEVERGKEVREPTRPSPAEEEVVLKPKKYPGIEGEVLESSLLKDIHFEFDRYDLTPEAKRILAENAQVLLEHPTWKIQIEGHCDERGSNEYNLALGEKRARSARNYLIKLGIAPERLSIISYGEEMPLDPRHCEEAWAKNRRCHFVILSK